MARAHWASIRQALRDATYQPSPARRTEIPKRQGQGTRGRGLPTGVDRILPQASAQVLGPLFAPECGASSVGCRPGRAAHHAGTQIQSYIQTGYRVAGDLDLAKFFDRLNHAALRARVARKGRDKARLRVMGQYLRAGGLVGEQRQPTETGVPHGAPVSPWLANLWLDDLDQKLARRGHRVARYGDAVLLVGKSPRAGARVKAPLTGFLQRHRKLELTESKSTVGLTPDGPFRGVTFHATPRSWSPQACQDLRQRLRELTGRSGGVSLAYRIRKLNEYLRGSIQ